MPALETFYSQFESPVGEITLVGDQKSLLGLYMPAHKHWKGLPSGCQRNDDVLAAAREQLTEYFAGERQEFDLPFRFVGTPFQQRVWQELWKIPFGVTISYAEMARRVGQPTATRAVGAANGRNPISIIVPCHRVIASDGKLTGYGGGMENKRWLLDFELANAPTSIFARQ
ncbi:methylated-DNA--[protein]-cysteine S-methyltransferase [Anatilimnocola floriformis]|uniref:methylated-DNA--[protein]-cysteine S-methyltransferase n=1 Tax=Anatilimnocola floriformis TaxID=2948575 RepID=UPI0020C58AF0|nr:methylated-DNA--[protein]-cysteine S-methyltransferase [Anatilimnocola floriformis]